jgi:hypothetical protein
MKIRLLLGTIIGAVALNGANAGSYCPPAKDCAKCPVECCDELNGKVGVSYMTDYIFRGVRYSRDAVGLNASYRIDNCYAPVTVGVSHISSLGSNTFNELGITNGDQSDLFVAVGLPSLFGFDFGVRYDHYFYPNARPLIPGIGDSHGAIGFTASKEIYCGLVATIGSTYDFNQPSARTLGGSNANPVFLPNDDNGAWIHTAGLSYTTCVTDCISVNLSAGVLYTDNLYRDGSGSDRSSGWSSYYAEAALPISLGKCATLSPYVGYNATPDTWLADGFFNGIPGANENDVFYGGVRFNVGF